MEEFYLVECMECDIETTIKVKDIERKEEEPICCAMCGSTNINLDVIDEL